MLNEVTQARAEWYKNNGIDIKLIPVNVKTIFGSIDGKEVCVRVDHGIESEFIWSNNKPMINIFKSYFENLWKNADSIQ